MHIEGPKWTAPAPKPELKKAKTGGLIDAIKKAAEKGLAAQAKGLGQAIKQVAADADQTQKSPGATSRLGLPDAGGKISVSPALYTGGAENITIGSRTRISASNSSGELV